MNIEGKKLRLKTMMKMRMTMIMMRTMVKAMGAMTVMSLTMMRTRMAMDTCSLMPSSN